MGNVGQGFVKGTLTFGGGLLKGVTGIVADPAGLGAGFEAVVNNLGVCLCAAKRGR